MDVDNLLQYLIPIIFLIVWAIGKVFSPKRPEPTKSSHTARPTSEPFDEAFDLDAEEYETTRPAPLEQRREVTISTVSLPQPKKYPGDSSSRTRDINHLSKSFILNELSSSTDGKRTKQNSEIRILLKDPHALRKAFLICEILGQPLSLRKNGKMGRSWQR